MPARMVEPKPDTRNGRSPRPAYPSFRPHCGRFRHYGRVGCLISLPPFHDTTRLQDVHVAWSQSATLLEGASSSGAREEIASGDRLNEYVWRYNHRDDPGSQFKAALLARAAVRVTA